MSSMLGFRSLTSVAKSSSGVHSLGGRLIGQRSYSNISARLRTPATSRPSKLSVLQAPLHRASTAAFSSSFSSGMGQRIMARVSSLSLAQSAAGTRPGVSQFILNQMRSILYNSTKGFKNFPKSGEKPFNMKNKNSSSKKKADGKSKSKGKGKKGSGSGNSGDPANEPGASDWLMPAGAMAVMLALFSSMGGMGSSGGEITYQAFQNNFLETGTVERLQVVNGERVLIFARSTSQADQNTASNVPVNHFTLGGSVESFERKLEDLQREMGIRPSEFIPIQYTTEHSWISIVGPLLPYFLMGGIAYMLLKNSPMAGGAGGKGGPGGIFNVGKSKATLIKPEMAKVRFKDVAGMDEAKVEVMEFVKFLKNPERYSRLGAKIPKGALLSGPPGTGKTLLAKATAGEANVKFYSVSGSDFVEMFVGVGSSRMREMFAEARKNSPCIIFIDEIDAVGRARQNNSGMGGGGSSESENTLNQLLVEMDGFKTSESVVVLAGTNRKDILDKALLRPGRFDRDIVVNLPDIKGRVNIFKVHLKPIAVADHIDTHELAQKLAALTPGFSGADIANVCNEAALHAARMDQDEVYLHNFEAAVDRVVGGLPKASTYMDPAEKKRVAYHEAGHAVVGWFSEHASPLMKVTIVPRTNGALGFAQFLPKDISLYTTDKLNDQIRMSLGGRAAEEVFFGDISTGASDDIRKVTDIAYGAVATYGMNSKLGHVAYERESQNPYLKNYSDHTGRLIDEEVAVMVQEQYDRTIDIVQEHKVKLGALAEKLLEVETINHDTIVEILGERPFESDSYTKFIEASNADVQKDKEQMEKEAAEKKKRKEEGLDDEDDDDDEDADDDTDDNDAEERRRRKKEKKENQDDEDSVDAVVKKMFGEMNEQLKKIGFDIQNNEDEEEAQETKKKTKKKKKKGADFFKKENETEKEKETEKETETKAEESVSEVEEEKKAGKEEKKENK